MYKKFICQAALQNVLKIVGYQILLRITRFVTLVIRSDYQKFCLIKIDPCQMWQNWAGSNSILHMATSVNAQSPSQWYERDCTYSITEVQPCLKKQQELSWLYGMTSTKISCETWLHKFMQKRICEIVWTFTYRYDRGRLKKDNITKRTSQGQRRLT